HGPIVTASTADLAAGSTTLTIAGSGFGPSAANNLVILSSGAGVVTAATANSLTMTLTALPTAGLLSAVVLTDGISSGTLTSVATVVPIINVNSAKVPATATTLIIKGAGFDPIASHNLIAFSSGSGTVTAATATQLTVTFSSPPLPGPLSAFLI